MAQISIIQHKDILEAHRFDAEYFKPEYLRRITNLNKLNSDELNNKATITDGEHGSPDLDSSSGICYLSGHNVKDNVLDLRDIRYCTKKLDEKNKRSRIKRNNVLLSIVGTVGNATVIYKDFLGNTDRNVATIKDIDLSLNHYYLSTFLNSQYGRFQTIRFQTGNVQPLLNLTQVRKIKIPIFPQPFQIQIEKMVKEAHQKQSQSKRLYAEAEELLLEELGLVNYKAKHSLSYETTKKEIEQATRFDAEYFQPKYAEIIEHIENYEGGFEALEEFIMNYSTGYPFKSSSYVENGCYLIRINNIEKGKLNIENANKIPNEDISLSKKDIAKENDILISMSGTIGNACKIPKGIEAVINQRIFRFTPINFNEEVLTLLINSVIGFSQLQRIGTGGVQTNISGNDIKKIKIPLIKQSVQKQIAEKIQESHSLRKESKELLEEAKRKVEDEIEKN